MATGLVIRMHRGQVNTPNEGDVLDFETGREYHFRRPDEAFGVIPRKWNVCKGDVISFSVSGEAAVNVLLYRRRQEGVVRGGFPIFGPTTSISGSASGRSYIIAEFGGKLQLVGITGGTAAIGA